MNAKQLITSLVLLVTVFGFSNFTLDPEPPTREEALAAYNQGVKLANSEPTQAISLFEKAVSIAEKLDTNGTDILKKATSKLPGLYYNVSASIAKEKKYSEAIASFEKTIEVATKYENEKIVKASKKTLPKMYYAQGSGKLKAKDYAGSIADFDKSLALNPGYLKANYMKAVALKNTGEIDAALAEFDIAIEKGDEKMIARSKKGAYNALKGHGKKLNASKDYTNAIKYLTMATEKYAPVGKDAADTAKKNAGVHFELGKAYWAKGNKAKACASYKKAAHGQYKANADYQLKNVVKCI